MFFLLMAFIVCVGFAVGYFMPYSSHYVTYTDPAVMTELKKLNRQMSDHIMNTKSGLYDRLSESRNCYGSITSDVKKPGEGFKL